jgi:hypothetical protein
MAPSVSSRSSVRVAPSHICTCTIARTGPPTLSRATTASFSAMSASGLPDPGDLAVCPTVTRSTPYGRDVPCRTGKFVTFFHELASSATPTAAPYGGGSPRPRRRLARLVLLGLLPSSTDRVRA